MAGLFRRPKRGWWQQPAGWALALALVLPSGMLAIPLSQSRYASAWAPAAAVTGLAIALAATVGFFVVKRNSWLLAAPLSFGLSFSFALALVEGWNTQLNVVLAVAQVVLVIGAIVLAVFAFVVLGRSYRRFDHLRRDTAREVGEHIAHEGLFRDDGERIIVYAERGRVLLRAIAGVAVLALFVAGGLWVRTVVANVLWQIAITVGIGFLLCFGGVPTLLLLLRTVMTGPTIVVNADGILDNGSMIATGRGLLRWNETLGVEEYDFSPNPSLAITYRYLEINVADPRAIEGRQPLWKRALARFAGPRQSTGFRIQRALLDRPPDALVTAINRYINAHAPEGSWHKAATDDDEAKQLGED